MLENNHIKRKKNIIKIILIHHHLTILSSNLNSTPIIIEQHKSSKFLEKISNLHNCQLLNLIQLMLNNKYNHIQSNNKMNK